MKVLAPEEEATMSQEEFISPARNRVKVYELRDNDWFDRGTGFVEAAAIKQHGTILVASEEKPTEVLLEVPIRRDEFQKQQETLIVWTDLRGTDLALSFQEAEGCLEVHTALMDFQMQMQPDGKPSVMILPQPSIGNLGDIDRVIQAASVTAKSRDSLVRVLIERDFLKGLVEVFELAEDFENVKDLHSLCNIMKMLVLYNEMAIIERIVTDELIMGVVGMLEYDPEFPTHKANHRQYLSKASRFKEVVPIENDDIKRKIQSTYRLQYLKDVVLARVLDDATFSILNSMIYYHQIDIVSYIASDLDFLLELLAIVNDGYTEITESETPVPTRPPVPFERRKDAILFLQQMCTMTKSFQHQPQQKQTLYENLVKCGLFPAIVFALQHSNATMRVAGTDVLIALIDHDISIIRNYIYESDSTGGSVPAEGEKGKQSLTDTLIDILLNETDLGVKAQVADAVKVLLDTTQADLDMSTCAPSPEGPVGEAAAAQKRNEVLARHPQQVQQLERPASKPSAHHFLTSFLSTSATRLFQPLLGLEQHQQHFTPLALLSQPTAALYTHLIEILIFLLRQRTPPTTAFITAHNLILRVAALLKSPEKPLVLTAIKFYRCIIDLNTDSLNAYLAANHAQILFPILNIIHAATSTGPTPRDNLLTSAALELFEFIRRNYITCRSLIFALGENYRPTLEVVPTTYIDTLQGILLHHEQLLHPPPPASAASTAEDTDVDVDIEDSQADTEPLDHSSMIDLNMPDGDTDPAKAQARAPVNGGRRWQGLSDLSAEEEAYFDADDNEDEKENEDEAETSIAELHADAPASQREADDVADDFDADVDEMMKDKPSSESAQTQTQTGNQHARENGVINLRSLSPGKHIGLGLAMEMGQGTGASVVNVNKAGKRRLVEYDDEEEEESGRARRARVTRRR